MPNARISGTGFFVPPKVMTNHDLSQFMDTNDEWIQERTGIKERRYVENGVSTSDIAIPAVEMAMERAAVTKQDIGLIIFATSTPDYYAPGSGCLLQEKMDFPTIGALDIRVQCSGFVYGLSVAQQYIENNIFEHVLVVGAEVQSTAMDLSTRGRDTAVIFGDGAGAAVVSASQDDSGILSTHLHSEGKHCRELWVEAPSSGANPRLNQEILNDGRHFLQMNGREVFRHAVTRFPEVIMEGLDANGLTSKDIDLLVPHQANVRIAQMIQKRLKLEDNQVYLNIHKYGNTTAASIPIALSEAMNEGRVNKGDIVVFAAFGSGFTWASAIVKW
jgi:3-oxoacyl-[acyl-carrier-protein] synthase III